jgi:hypothetical protein
VAEDAVIGAMLCGFGTLAGPEKGQGHRPLLASDVAYSLFQVSREDAKK